MSSVDERAKRTYRWIAGLILVLAGGLGIATAIGQGTGGIPEVTRIDPARVPIAAPQTVSPALP